MATERNKGIGERIRQCREELALTQEELARQIPAVPVTGNVISRWERGRNRPSAEYLEDLAQALDVPAGYLLFGRDGRAATAPVADTGASAHLESIATSLAGIHSCLAELVQVIGEGPSRGQQLEDVVARTIEQLGGDPDRSRTAATAQKPERTVKRARTQQ